MKEISQLTRIIEAALFAAEKPLSVDRLLELFDENERPEKAAIKKILEMLKQDYVERGIELKELGTGYQFQVRPDLAKWIQRLWEERAPRYSRALLETLALIAYRQPITRSEIEDIRGVAVNSHITKTLLEREWIRVVGYRDVPGKPALMATTKEFLDYFGLSSLDQLPPLSELQDLDKLGESLAQRLQDGKQDRADESEKQEASGQQEEAEQEEESDAGSETRDASDQLEEMDVESIEA